MLKTKDGEPAADCSSSHQEPAQGRKSAGHWATVRVRSWMIQPKAGIRSNLAVGKNFQGYISSEFVLTGDEAKAGIKSVGTG